MSDVRFTAAIKAMNDAREANGIDLNGKKYSMVKDRVEVLRQQFGMEVGIDTDVSPLHGSDIWVAKAKLIHNPSGTILGSGHAMAFYGSDEINTTSVVEAVETAAIGRALASFGLHGGEYASGQEMQAIPMKKQAAAKMTTGQRFVEEVKQVFHDDHPKVTRYDFYIPPNNSPDEMDKAFMEIDRIEDDKELYAYYYALEKDYFPLLDKEMENEFIQSFKSRKNQLKG